VAARMSDGVSTMGGPRLGARLKHVVRLGWDYPSQWGDRLGWNWLTYNPGVFFEFDRIGRRNAPLFGAALLAVFPTAVTFADVGCGTGQFAAFLVRHQRQVTAYEYSALGRWAARRLALEVQSFDLAESARAVPPRVDLAFSLEVGEHIPAALAPAFVRFLTDASATVVVTCAPPGQAGNGHINCRPKAYWQALFEADGSRPWPEKEADLRAALAGAARLSPFLRDNLMVFRRAA
jgi:SAM-dependent methyltransferase